MNFLKKYVVDVKIYSEVYADSENEALDLIIKEENDNIDEFILTGSIKEKKISLSVSNKV